MTTIELKCNFLGSAAVGRTLFCEATLLHAGKTTQVWDAVVSVDDKKIAYFRCTEMVLYPQASE